MAFVRAIGATAGLACLLAQVAAADGYFLQGDAGARTQSVVASASRGSLNYGLNLSNYEYGLTCRHLQIARDRSTDGHHRGVDHRIGACTRHLLAQDDPKGRNDGHDADDQSSVLHERVTLVRSGCVTQPKGML